MSTEEKDVLRVESATITDVTIKERQNAYETVTPYRIRHKFTGGTSRYYSSDEGDRTQDGDITITTGNQLTTDKVGELSETDGLDLNGLVKIKDGRMGIGVVTSASANELLSIARDHNCALKIVSNNDGSRISELNVQAFLADGTSNETRAKLMAWTNVSSSLTTLGVERQNAAMLALYSDTNKPCAIGTESASDLVLSTNDTIRMIIAAGGNINIKNTVVLDSEAGITGDGSSGTPFTIDPTNANVAYVPSAGSSTYILIEDGLVKGQRIDIDVPAGAMFNGGLYVTQTLVSALWNGSAWVTGPKS